MESSKRMHHLTFKDLLDKSSSGEMCPCFAIEVRNMAGTQSWTKSWAKVCEELANQGKKIILAGLDKDYSAKPFKQIAHLLALSNDIKKLNAICVQCGDLANFSKRTTSETKQVIVGESEKYEARCRKCYYNKKGNV